MTEEIKEILNELESLFEISEAPEHIINEFNKIKDYITNLQQNLEVSQTNEEIYRLEMQEITKIFGLDEHTLFDDVKEYATNLQQENERLEENNQAMQEEMARTWKITDDYKSRCEKAIEHIKEHQLIYINQYEEESNFDNHLLDILQGSDKNENSN